MKIVRLVLCGVFTIALIVLLNFSWKAGGQQIPAFGMFLSPQEGIWQNAEATDHDFSQNFNFPQLKGKASVYMDDRLVPHIFAEDENDAYFIQGYIHARFRLWQMEFQTHAAAGRLSELVGEKALAFDRDKRRLGMVYAAERSLKEAESDPATKIECDQYTAGVNAYIHSLTKASLPLEYKLLNYVPEDWTNLKTALFLKYMSLDLAGSEDDFEMANSKSIFPKADFEKLYPTIMDSLDPIVPKGTVFPQAGIKTSPPSSADSLYFNNNDTSGIIEQKPDKDNGSNNWAVSGKKTRTGSPILCNDPHLGLNLPSLWFEMQISTPNYNVYGASFPGSPSIIIGYNDSCAFGFTNAMRDVRDYYEIRFRDDSRKEYFFNNEWKSTSFRVEKISIKGGADYLDSVAYTVFGPVMYDKSFHGDRATHNKYYAVRWKAHDPSNELKMFTLLNRAKNYNDYNEAIKNLHTPGQNCVFACKNGDIAIWDQGEFPAKWKRQGDFPMPGADSSYMWQGMIPREENPHQVNPERGYVSSANQLPADSTYPYYLGGSYPPYRAITINRRLETMNGITTTDMMQLQTDNYNVFASMAKPMILSHIDRSKLNEKEKTYLEILKNWNCSNDLNSTAATIFVITWDSLEHVVWDDEYNKTSLRLVWPKQSTLLDNILRDTAFKYLDNVNTAQVESLTDDVTLAFRKACVTIQEADAAGRLEWAKYKDTKVQHLARLDALSRLHLPIGGGTNTINATKSQHGPSWRMIVSLTPETEAYGVYPGGQSGNPGSRFYDNFIDTWVAGKYNTLWMMKASEEKDERVKWKLNFGPQQSS